VARVPFDEGGLTGAIKPDTTFEKGDLRNVWFAGDRLAQTVERASALGGFRLQGKGAETARRIVEDAKILEEAGAYSILLELVPDRVCQVITERANIPIISLGFGPQASGQLPIYHDMFGLYPKFTPKMARVYGNAGEVTHGSFPGEENCFGMKDEEFDQLVESLD
jgi:3-methyl-2-oxobutanoate hydroxymethyltransferase